MLKDFLFVIVIYNEEIKNSITYNKIKEVENLLIIDNSTKDNNNLEFSANNNIYYHSMEGNKGLSKAYNYAIEFIKDKEYNYIVLLDDDSNLEADYLIKLNNLKKNDNTVYLSKIIVEDKIISPIKHSKYLFMQSINVKKSNPEKVYKKISGINSGMIISYDFFKNYHYDEKLFLDCIDFKFIDDCYQNNTNVKTFEGVIHQNLSVSDIKDQNYKGSIMRLNIRLKDLKAYSNHNWFQFIINKITLLLMYYIRTKNIKYIRDIFKGVK